MIIGLQLHAYNFNFILFMHFFNIYYMWKYNGKN